MEPTIAPNPKPVQKSQPITSADPHLDTVNTEQGATAGMPVFLQRSSVSQATTFLQPKLTVNEPGDQYEQEADRIADQVMRMPEPTIQRQMEPEKEEAMVQRQVISDKITPLVQRQVSPEIVEENVIQTKAIDNQITHPTSTQESSEVPASVHEALSSTGQPLNLPTRSFMEPRFGHDLSRVRVHTGAAAEKSARDVNAHAYTVGHNMVFGAGRFAPGTNEGRRLIAHELTHVVQQGGEGDLIQRAPANYPSNDPIAAQTGPKPDSSEKKSQPQLTPDNLIWELEVFRRKSPQEFVKLLTKYDGSLYPILSPYGFRGSWTKDQAYLDDFDAAIVEWEKSQTIRLQFVNMNMSQFGNISQTVSRQKPKSREEKKYEYAQYLVKDMNRHGYGRGKVNHELESVYAYGLMDDLVSHGFEKYRSFSFHPAEEYKYEAIAALNDYIDRYDAAHGIKHQTSANVPTQGEVEFYRAWLEGAGYVMSSFFAALAANTARKFTSDPKKITAAAGVGQAFEGVIFSVAGAFVGSYRPEVVGPRDRPAAVGPWRYTVKQPIKPTTPPTTTVPRVTPLPTTAPKVTPPATTTPSSKSQTPTAQISQWIDDVIEGLPQPVSTPLDPANFGRSGRLARPVVSSIAAVDTSDLTDAKRAALEADFPGYVNRTQAKIKAGTRSPKSLLSRDDYVRLRHGYATSQLGGAAPRPPRQLGDPGAIEQEAGHVLEKIVDSRLPAGSSNTSSFPNPYGDPVIPDHLPPGAGKVFIDPAGRQVKSGGTRFSARYVGDSKYRDNIPINDQTRGFVNLARMSDESTLVFYVKWQDQFPAADKLTLNASYGGRVLPVRPWNEKVVAPGLREFARTRGVRIRLVSDPQWR